MTMTTQMLMGQNKAHLMQLNESHWLHKDSLAAFLALQKQAKRSDFNLQVVSSFRSFEQQMAIWNAKFNGQRPVLDSNSQPLDTTTMSTQQKIKAILRWSALPGASRHHWGCDIDVYDPELQAGHSALQLIPQEYQDDGPQAPLSQWLDANMQDFGFFRPYQTDRGGVSPEPWHLSHSEVSTAALAAFNCDDLVKILSQSDVAGHSEIIKELDWIEQQVIRNIDNNLNIKNDPKRVINYDKSN